MERERELELVNHVLARIDRDELVQLALDLGNIYSPNGEEAEVSAFLYRWLERHQFHPRRLALAPDRPNIVGCLEGTGGGYSLLFNSHMDTAIVNDSSAGYLDPGKPEYHHAWVEGDRIIGNGVVNDKGPMAAWLVAAKAIKESGVALLGDLVLTMAVGEITREPVDEYLSPEYLGKETGTRYLATHGAIADFVLVAEASGFSPAWVEAGKAFFKVTVHGTTPLYTPYLPPRAGLTVSPNAIVRAAALINALEEWAERYQEQNTYTCAGGTVTPKVNIGAIRGGIPFRITRTVELCSLYLDVRLAPGQDPLAVRSELRDLLQSASLQGQVELFLYRRGYEGQGVEPLVAAINTAHQRVFGVPPVSPAVEVSSMWRDINVYNELGIPALTYGPASGTGGGNNSMAIDDLMRSAQVYAMVALEICRQEKK